MPSCAQALEKYNIEKDIAAFIKKEFDKKYNPTWHAIVGRNFGSYVTHETKHFIYFYLGKWHCSLASATHAVMQTSHALRMPPDRSFPPCAGQVAILLFKSG